MEKYRKPQTLILLKPSRKTCVSRLDLLLLLDKFNYFTHWAVKLFGSVSRCRPTNCIFDYGFYLFYVICGKSFVPGLEIKNFSVYSLPCACTSKSFKSRICAEHQYFVGRGNFKSFAVEFLLLKVYVIAYARHYRVSGIYVPKPLLLFFTSCEVACCSHEFFEMFAVVR